MSNDSWESYFIEGTSVLKNKFNISDKKELEQKEKDVVLIKLSELGIEPIKGDFDSSHLIKIHKFLFEDIYPFAGKFRTCTMAKTTREFYDPDIIKDELTLELQELNEEVKNILSIRAYSMLLAKSYYNLMSIHPFREGNGRSVREFLREFVLEKNKELPFSVELDFTQMNPDNFLKGVEYRYIYPSMLDLEFYDALVEIDKTNNKNI